MAYQTVAILTTLSDLQGFKRDF